MTLKVTDNLS